MATFTYVDLDLNFIPNPVTGDISKNVGNKAVINAVQNLVLTNFYERPFHPDIGSNCYKLLFEPMTSTTANAIQREIGNVIKNYEPRVTVNTITVTADYDNNGFNVEIEFYINNSTVPVAVAFFLERIS